MTFCIGSEKKKHFPQHTLTVDTPVKHQGAELCSRADYLSFTVLHGTEYDAHFTQWLSDFQTSNSDASEAFS